MGILRKKNNQKRIRSIKTKVEGEVFDISFHDGGVIFYKEGNNIRGWFDLGGCNYLFSKRFFTFLPNYEQDRDGLIELEINFLNYSHLNIKCNNPKFILQPMIIEISDYDLDYPNGKFIKFSGWLDDEAQSEIEISFNYESTEMQYWFEKNEEFLQVRKSYTQELIKGGNEDEK